ncbi:MAG TPA: ABC transporter permease [Bryobacteraceae bacterium]|jgi:predicted permease
MDTLLHDSKHAFRLLRKSPGFTIAAVSALALGIGANTAIFSVIDTVLLKPLPYPEPERIVQILLSSPNGNGNITSVPKFIVQRDTSALEEVCAYDTGGPGINLTTGDRPEQLKGIRVSRDFFKLFGAHTALGRTFTPEEDLPGGGKNVVLSYGLWQRRFGSDPSLLGKAIPLGAEPYTVIGVLAPGFDAGTPADVLLPLQADPNSIDQVHYLRAAGRLKPGVTLQQANAALQISAETFRRKFPGAIGPKNSFVAQPLQDIVVANVRTELLVLLGAVAFVLLIACANVANLLLARAAGRAREIAIRAAIGAGRGRIVRQLLTESVLLSLAGGVLGLAVGATGVRALLALNTANLPRVGKAGSAVALDWRVAAFTILLALTTGILFGLVPALHASRSDLGSTLKESGARSGSGLRQNKLRSLLIVAEMALAIVLLAGAGLLIRTFMALRGVAPGFDPHNVITMQTSLTGSRFEKTANVDSMIRQVTERVEAIPGVQSASVTISLPLEPSFGLGFAIEGRPHNNGPADGGADWRYMSARYFEVFRIPIVRGRAFTVRDDGAAPGVVLINESFARRFFPKENPVGQRMTIAPGAPGIFKEPPREIVGVLADVRDDGLNSDPGPIMYVPIAQVRDGVMALNNRIIPVSWAVRTNVAPQSLALTIQNEIQSTAGIPAANVRTMQQVMRESTARDEFNTFLLGVFAFSAMLLASIGLYGLMAYSVQQRTLEFGIRLALGADSPGLRNMVVFQAMKLAVAGIVLGVAAAYGLTRFMATLLFQVKPTDPYVFVSVAATLAAVALLAAWIPARRAVRIDPIVALRYE